MFYATGGVAAHPGARKRRDNVRGAGKKNSFRGGTPTIESGDWVSRPDGRGTLQHVIIQKNYRKIFSLPSCVLVFRGDLGYTVSPMNKRQKAYVQNRARGMSRERSAILAGYPAGQEAGKQVESMPTVQEELAKIRAQMADAAGVSKEDIVQMLMDAAALAKLQADPTALVGAARELGKMLGFYAPEVKKTISSIDKNDLRKALRDMQEDELYRLAYGQVIEGEAKLVEDKTDADVPKV